MRDNEGVTQRLAAQPVLNYLLDKAARRLSGLEEPVVVAACPNKFDDTGRFPDWLGVQVGRAVWERTDYSQEGHYSVSEKSQNPDDLLAARDVLRWLQEAEWRPLVERVLDLKLNNEVLAIIKQHGGVWFVIAASNDGEDIVFLLGPSGELDRVGAPARLDQRLGLIRPLILERIDPEAWSRLHAAVPAFPVDEFVCEEDAQVQSSRVQLAAHLQDALSKLRELPTSLRYVASASRGLLPLWRVIAADGFQILKESWCTPDMYAKMIARHGVLAEALDAVLNALESARWRDLFARAIMPMALSNSLALLVRGSECWLIANEIAVFVLAPNGNLNLVGACDRIRYGESASSAVIHLFNSSTV